MDDAAKHTVIPEILPLGMGYARKGNLSEVLCKPKIMPIKSATLEQIEQMEKEFQAEAMLPVFGMPDTPVLTQRPLARSFGAGGMLARNVAPEDVADILQIPLSQVQEAKGAMELTGSTCYEETGESPLEEDEDGADEEPFSPVFVSPDGPSLEVPTAEPEADEDPFCQ
ncbi:hypothetical protein AK812_SmicGene12274 [Symbiodinium microadriaticum]|uniref:Uncharacterized protein n=1 Tax=Symbiodinium microadriaticum TaxID=2951 RepID=A0A1Q9EB20_SYMMI|nr:hypothetical protein AK812_SmicGene12274 [Symbiodinium microadriaticum]CAE7643706.1 unnamed protein product [Symbiodinium microadriaticum]